MRTKSHSSSTHFPFPFRMNFGGKIRMASDDTQLVEAVSFLTQDGSKTRTEIAKAVSVIKAVATEKGLEPDCIEALMDFVTGTGNGSVSTKLHILRCLIPRTTVPVRAFIHGLGSMRSLSLSLQQLLLRWMVLVFDLLDNKKSFQSLYDVIFQYLAYDSLRPAACQLLCYMTERRHVKEFRVMRLVELCKRVVVQRESSEASLMALLGLYKLHCPHLVPLSTPPGRKVWFRPFEKELAGNIARVQKKRSEQPQTTVSSSASFQRCISVAPPPKKRRKKAPSVPSLLPSYRPRGDDDNHVPVMTLTSVQELCGHIDQLELPGMMGAALESPLLQHVLALWPDPSAAFRLTYWLRASLDHDYNPGDPESPNLLHILKCAGNLTEFLLEPIPTVEEFISILLVDWNGDNYREELFKLISYLSLRNFDELRCDYLEPLKKLYVKKDLRFKCHLLSCLTNLLHYWASVEWPRHQKKTDDASERLCVFPESIWNGDEVPDLNLTAIFSLLIGFLEQLLRVGLEKERAHSLIQHAAGNLYEVVTKLPGCYGIPLLRVPHPQIVNLKLLSFDLAPLDRILSCYIRCKASLTSIKKNRRELATIKVFNGGVLDMCDALWRNRAFSVSTNRPYPTHLFTTDRESLKSFYSINSRLSITHHPAFLCFVKEFFRETQDNAHDRLQPAAIWKDQRLKEAYLKYLAHKNITGIPNFIQIFILSRK